MELPNSTRERLERIQTEASNLRLELVACELLRDAADKLHAAYHDGARGQRLGELMDRLGGCLDALQTVRETIATS